MPYRVMLDTNIISNSLRYPEGAAALRFKSYEPGEICVSVVVSAELQFGAVKIGSDRLFRQLDEAAQLYDVVPWTIEIVPFYAAARVALERKGTPIGSNDLLIAAHALALDLPIVTDNTREFSRVPNLRVENWLD